MAKLTMPDAVASWRWRNIGPFRGGRVSAVAGDPRRPLVFYFGACAGGVFKTEDAGITWHNVSDGYFQSASIGDIAVAPSDSNVVYVATGEAHIRGNVVAGDGVYKSTDGGETWVHLGLADTQHIGRIRVHPTNPDVVYVAALGHAFGPNVDRGVYRSRDGGQTWDHVLDRGVDVGAIDLALDVHNPRRILASMWRVRRYPYKLESGGPGSGLWESRDGGDSWRPLTERPGLPDGVWGKVGVAISPASPGRWWALIEAGEGGLYRSDDAGESWTCVNARAELRARSFYYNHVFADPQQKDTVFVLNFNMWKSTDGGRHFDQLPTPHGDNHGLWIDANNPDRLIEGNDGGACVSFNGGQSWSSIYNQPTGQFYHVTTDSQFPYRVYGAQQDNWTLSLPSRSDLSGIGWREIYEVGGAESGYVAVNPADPAIVYAGSSGGGEGGRLTRYDHRTRQRREVSAWPQRTAGLPAEGYKWRFQWTAPIHLSPHDPATVYSCANVVFRSRDEGETWERISPDLTRNDAQKLGPSGGPLTPDHTGVEVYCTVFAFAESPRVEGLLWAGSDDGMIHVSRDAGATWDDVTPPRTLLPDWALISTITPSVHDPDTVYVAATRYKWDDRAPYLLKTRDGGRTWHAITAGIAPEDFTRVIREVPGQPGCLVAGTESGVYLSWDDGERWRRLQLNLPIVPIHDAVIHDDDLIVATHGRGFWILDDVTGLRDPGQDSLCLFIPKPAVRLRPSGRLRWSKEALTNVGRLAHPTIVLEAPAGDSHYLVEQANTGEAPRFADQGQNPADGAVLHYVLPPDVSGPVSLTIRDEAGEIVRTFSSESQGKERTLAADPGAHAFVWNLRHVGPPPLGDTEAPADGEADGALVVPGTYQAELQAAGRTARVPVTVVADPRVSTAFEHLVAQRDFVQSVVQTLTGLRQTVTRAREVRDRARAWARQIEGTPYRDTVDGLIADRVARIEELASRLARPPAPRGLRPMALSPRLEDQLTYLRSIADTADYRPTAAMQRLYQECSRDVERVVGELEAAIAVTTRDVTDALTAQGIPLV